MSGWDDSDSDDDKPETKPQTQPTAKAAAGWDDSEASEDDEQPQPPQKATTTTNAWDESEESDNAETQEQTQENGTTKSPSSELAEPANTKDTEADAAAKAKAEEEQLKKLKKKQQNYKNKQKRKNKRKNKKKQALPPPKTQSSIPKNQDEIISMSSEDSSSDSDDDKRKKKKKMESYDDRMRTDNDILFEGHEVAKQNRMKAKPKKVDNRAMLSGEVTLKNFPLGSSKDCENFADQITGHLDQKLYEESINTNDIFLFYKKLLSANVIENLDMVDTKELCTKLNSLLASKQKAWHTKKNPKGKKKKKPQWIVADKFNSGGKSKKTGHVDGGFDPDEYSLFD